MKILLVITKSEIGGAQFFVLNLAIQLKKAGHDVTVAAGDGDFLQNALAAQNISFHYLEALKRKVSLFTSIAFMTEFYAYAKTNHFDIVHLNSTNTLLATLPLVLLRKSKIVFTVHGLSLVDANSRVNPILKLSFRIYYTIFLRLVDECIFVCNANLKEALQTKLVSHGIVVYNGIDENELAYLPKNEARTFFSDKYSIDFSDSFIIGSIGRLAYQKHYDFLIRVFPKIKKAIPNAKVLIVGDGPDFEIYLDLLKQMGIESDFYFVGAINFSYRYIKAFDLFVLPSIFEGLSISLLEGLFADVPLLCTRIGGNSEIIDNNDAELFELNNEHEFIAKMKYLAANGSTVASCNQVCKAKFRIEHMVDGYLAVYAKVLKP